MLKTVSSISSIHNGLELWIDTNKLNVVYCEYKIGEISSFFDARRFTTFSEEDRKISVSGSPNDFAGARRRGYHREKITISEDPRWDRRGSAAFIRRGL